MIRVALFLALVVCIGAAPFRSDLKTQWELYKKVFKKSYKGIEEGARRLIWERNIDNVNMHNIEADLQLYAFRLGINHLSDKSAEEYSMLNGFRMQNRTLKTTSIFMAPSNVVYPKEVDWRKEGLVTEVKNQGQCGSCWAFSTTGTLEGQHQRKTGELLSLSEQNLVDCSHNGNDGCDGGLIDYAFEYIKENGGIDSEESYPYIGIEGKCQFRKSKVGATLSGYIDIPTGDETALMKAVATVGPVSVAIDASHKSFQMYRSGIYNEKLCSSEALNHGVLVVGYGTENGNDFWIVKNSWSDAWGEKGYIRMSRNKNNQCGIATMASYPLV